VTTGIRNFPRGVLSTLDRLIKDMKGRRGRPDGFVGTDEHGLAETEQLGTGTADATTFLRGDGVWDAPAGSATAGDVVGVDVSTSIQNIVAYQAVDGKHITELTGTQGMILYHDGTVWNKLSAGTAGYFLQTGGAGANPVWAAESAGAGDVTADDLSVTSGNIVAYNGGGGQNIIELSGTQGDILYHNGTSWVKLAAGTYGHMLRTRGAAANPSWGATDEIVFISPSDCTATNINAALAGLTNGGVVQLPAGDYEMDAGLVIGESQTLRGAGQNATWLYYDNDLTTDIVTLTDHFAALEDLTVSGQSRALSNNGEGGAGTGRGVVIARVSGALDFIAHPAVRRVSILCTPSWNFYDTGATVQTQTGTHSHPPTISTGYSVSVLADIEQLHCAFANSGGAVYVGGGNAAPKFKGLKTNNYSFGTYSGVAASGAGLTAAGQKSPMGAVHLFNLNDAHFDDNCAFQSPAIQSTGVAEPHYDNDATMISFLKAHSVTLHQPYFEVLSANLLGTHPDGAANGRPSSQTISCTKNTSLVLNSAALFGNCWAGQTVSGTGIQAGTVIVRVNTDSEVMLSLAATDSATDNLTFGDAGRTHWLITSEDCYDLSIIKPYIRSSSTPSGTDDGYPLRIWRTTSDPNASGTELSIRGGHAYHYREVDAAPVAPKASGDPTVWDRDDFVFAMGGDASYDRPILIENFKVTNLTSGTAREPTTPANPDEGFAVMNRANIAFNDHGNWMQFGKWTTVGSTTDTDGRAKYLLNHELRAGILMYCNATSTIRSGLWLSDRGNDFRQIAFCAFGTAPYASPIAGDLWSDTSTGYLKWYDGANWQTGIRKSLGTAAGDTLYYTASDTPARLAIGTVGSRLTVASGVPSWAFNNGTSSIAARTTDLGATTLLTGTAATGGIYNVSFYMQCGTAGDPGDTVTITLTYNDGTARTNTSVVLDASVTTVPKGALLTVYAAASTNITYTATIASPGAGTPSYSIEARLEAIG
jgi:hypothetical protein